MTDYILTTYSNGNRNTQRNLDFDEVICEIESSLGDIRYRENGLRTRDGRDFCYFDHNKGCIKARVCGRWYTWYVNNGGDDMTEEVFDHLTGIM